MQSKFSYITYPFFGTYVVPELDIDFNVIKAKINNSFKVVKKEDSGDYLEDLLNLEQLVGDKRFKFQVTATSTQELIMLDKRCVWGVDAVGVLHNIQRYEEFKCKTLKPSRITKNKYIWFNSITKPFEVRFSIKNIEDDILYYWFKLIYIDKVWEIYRVNEEYDGNTTICI